MMVKPPSLICCPCMVQPGAVQVVRAWVAC